MRTLGTQVRLRRLIRQHAALLDRLAEDPADVDLARSSAQRLAGLIGDVREAWQADLASARPSAELAVLDGHVRRSLKGMQAAAHEMRRAPAGVDWLRGQFRAAAVPLLLFLRGLEDTPEDLLEGWLAPSLARSA